MAYIILFKIFYWLPTVILVLSLLCGAAFIVSNAAHADPYLILGCNMVLDSLLVAYLWPVFFPSYYIDFSFFSAKY